MTVPTLPRIGIMYDFRVPVESGRPWHELAASTLEACAELDAAGVDGVWLTEHHFTDDAYLPSVLTMAAAVAQRTERCRIGTSVLLAPLHHPLEIAESAVVVDNLTGGRFVLGMGIGYREEELAAFGVPKRERGRRLDETVAILHQAWSKDAVDHEGRIFQISGPHVQPKPVRESGIPLWLAARSEVAARRAGRVADGVIIAGGDEVIAWFDDAARESGRDRASLSVATLRQAVVADTFTASDLAQVEEALEWRSERYRRWYGDAADLPQDREFQSAGTATIATAFSTVEDELAALRDLAGRGVDEVIYHGAAPGIDPRAFLPQWRALITAVAAERA